VIASSTAMTNRPSDLSVQTTFDPFSTELVAELQRAHLMDEAAITQLNGIYDTVCKSDAALSDPFPAAGTLIAADANMVLSCELALTQNLGFLGLKALVQEQDQLQTTNIWMPNTDPTSWWMQTTGGYGLTTPEALNDLAKHVPWTSVTDLDSPFTAHPEVLDAVVSIMAEKFTVQMSCGSNVNPKSDLAFAGAAPIVLFSALGHGALRQFARAFAKTDPKWALLDTDERAIVAKTVLAAHRHCGFPACWLRLPWNEVGPLINTALPYRYPSVVRAIQHILGHARVIMVNRSQPRLILAYNGIYAQCDLDPEDLHLPLVQQNRKVLAAVLGVLKLTLKINRNDNISVRTALSALHLHHLIPAQDAAGSGLFLSSPHPGGRGRGHRTSHGRGRYGRHGARFHRHEVRLVADGCRSGPTDEVLWRAAGPRDARRSREHLARLRP